MNKLYKKDSGEWGLYKYLVKYTKNGEVCEQLTDDAEWFRTFANIHEDFTVDEVVELVYTDVQLSRLVEIKDYKFKDFEELADYVLDGIIRVDSAIFEKKNLEMLKEENEVLKTNVASMGKTIMELMMADLPPM